DGNFRPLFFESRAQLAKELCQVFAAQSGQRRSIEGLRADIDAMAFLEFLNDRRAEAELIVVTLAEVFGISQKRQAVVPSIDDGLREVLDHTAARAGISEFNWSPLSPGSPAVEGCVLGMLDTQAIFGGVGKAAESDVGRRAVVEQAIRHPDFEAPRAGGFDSLTVGADPFKCQMPPPCPDPVIRAITG